MDWPKITPNRRQFLQKATSRYQAALTDSQEAKNYLKERGFDEGTIARFQLGFVAEPLEGHEPARGYISFPHRSFSGPTGIRFRAVGDGEPRWWGESGQKSALYNVIDLHRPEPYIAICEGQTDTVTFSGLVGIPAVGISGASKWESHWDLLFVDYEDVLVLLDPDKGGDTGAEKLMNRLGDNARRVRLPADVNTTFLVQGSEFIKEKLGV